MTYSQTTGLLTVPGMAPFQGYAGNGPGKNNPAMQDVEATGPLPRGTYTVRLEPCDHPRCGPYCLRLVPDVGVEMFGRSGFLIHGDSKYAPGTASHGCIVVARAARLAIVATGASRLTVTE